MLAAGRVNVLLCVVSRRKRGHTLFGEVVKYFVLEREQAREQKRDPGKPFVSPVLTQLPSCLLAYFLHIPLLNTFSPDASQNRASRGSPRA